MLRSLFILLITITCQAEEKFILIDGHTQECVLELGANLEERFSPCSTFKIFLSLIGFEKGILKDPTTPSWDYQRGYDDYLEAWKTSLNPHTWMQTSCIWYSKKLALEIGKVTIQSYLTILSYGNQQMPEDIPPPGQIMPPWINKTLKISVVEQTRFIQKMVASHLPISYSAIHFTKQILFKEELQDGWKLYGKTGWSGSKEHQEHAWFVGWIEKEEAFFPFAYLMVDHQMPLEARVPRVKQLLQDSIIMSSTY